LELDAFITAKKALSKFMFPAPPITGNFDTTLNFNQTFSCISFASMIAPSPDWFMGLHNVDLFQYNGWIKDTTVSLVLYDAGTEEGDVFGYDNPETTPRQNISLLTPAGATVLANGNATIYAIGTARLTRD
ncbi:MAG: spondin domain-containing protein, partial [Ferruginibacter sp.]